MINPYCVALAMIILPYYMNYHRECITHLLILMFSHPHIVIINSYDPSVDVGLLRGERYLVSKKLEEFNQVQGGFSSLVMGLAYSTHCFSS